MRIFAKRPKPAPQGRSLSCAPCSRGPQQRSEHAVGCGGAASRIRFGPRSDDLEDAPYLGPDTPPPVQLATGTGSGMSCITGPLRLVTSGALEGGYSVNDYLVGGLTWNGVSSPTIAGPEGRGFKVQLAANYSGDSSLGVSQTITFRGANQTFLDAAAQYLGQPPGSMTNGTTINEPVLDA